MKAFFKNSVCYSKLLIVNSLVTLFFLFLDPSVLTAQDLPVGPCRVIYDKAVAFEKAGNFEKAILRYNAVKACDPNFKAKADSIILTVFRKVDARWKQAQKDKEQAEKDKQTAILARTREEQAKNKFEEQVITTEKALAEVKIQRKKADSLRVIAESGQRKAANLSKYYKRKAEQADRVLLTRIIEYMHLKHGEDDIAERLYAENLDDATIQEWSKSQILANEAEVSTIAVSSNGQFIFTGNAYGIGTLWDLDGNRLASFDGHYNAIVSACFSPDNKTILTASQDRTVNLWNLEGELIRTLFTADLGISYAAFSADAQKILIANYNEHNATLRDTSGKVLQTFKGYGSELTALALSADGQYVLTGSVDSTARLYKVTGELIKVFDSQQGSILSVAISPNGQYIATSSSDTSVWLWNKQGVGIVRFKHYDKVYSMSFSENNDYLLTGSADDSVRLFHWSDTTKLVLGGHSQAVSAVAFIPNSSYVISAASDKSVRLWDLRPDRLLQDTIQLQDTVKMEIYLSPNDSMFAVLSRRGELKIYTPDNKLLQTYKEEGTNAIVKAVFSPDSKAVLIATREREIKLLDLENNILQIFEGSNSAKDSIVALAFSADGQFILSQSSVKTRGYRLDIFQVKLWNRQGKLLKTLNNIYGLLDGFSVGRQSFLTHSLNYNALNQWDLEGQLNQGYNFQYFGISGYRSDTIVSYISTKYHRVITGGWDKRLRVFDTLGGLIRQYPIQKQAITALRISGDGQLIAVGSRDSMVRIWDTAGYLVKVLPRQNSAILALTFSPDNQKIWLCTMRGDIAIYNIKPIQGYSFMQLNNLGVTLEPDDYITIKDALLAEQIAQEKRYKRIREKQLRRNKIQSETIIKEEELRKKELEDNKKRIKEIVQSKNATLKETRDCLPIVLNLARFEIDSVKLNEYYHTEEVLFELYLAKQDTLKFRAAVASRYNSLAWSQILRREYAAAEKTLRHGIALDSTYMILYTNLAPALLFQGKFEAAKAQYLYWKDKEFNQLDLSTYRDAFWADFRSFEDADCIPPERLADVAAIKKLLSQ